MPTLLVVFLISGIASYGQQSGLGLQFMPLSSRDSLKSSSFVLPFFGEKAKAKGLHFEDPLGMGLQGSYSTQSFTASNLIIVDSTKSMSIRPDTMIQHTTASEYKLILRPNIWLFPFLNIYAIAGYTEGLVKPAISVPSFTLIIEDVGSLPIDTAFELNEPLKYYGPTFGFGASLAAGSGHYFVLADYHYYAIKPNDMEGKLFTHSFSIKAGIRIPTTAEKHQLSAWLGSMYISNKQRFRSTVNIEEISADVAMIIGKEASYSGDVTPIYPWNFVFGGLWTINQRQQLFFEAGFFYRKQLSIGYEFHF